MRIFVLLIFKMFVLISFAFGEENPYFHELKNQLRFRVGVSNTSNTKYFTDFKGTARGARITSLYLGLESGNRLSNKMQLYYGLQILNKGVKSGFNTITNSQVGFSLDYRYSLSYLELPIYLQLNAKRFSFKFGMTGSYLIKANFLGEFSDPGVPIFYYYANDISRLFKKFDFGIRIGIEKQIMQHIGLEFIFQKNFVNPYKPNSKELSMQQTIFLGIQYLIF